MLSANFESMNLKDLDQLCWEDVIRIYNRKILNTIN